MNDLKKYEQLKETLLETKDKIYEHLDKFGSSEPFPKETNLILQVGENAFTFVMNADLWDEISTVIDIMIKMGKELNSDKVVNETVFLTLNDNKEKDSEEVSDLEQYKQLKNILIKNYEKIMEHLSLNPIKALPNETNLIIGVGNKTFEFGMNADLYCEMLKFIENMIDMEKELIVIDNVIDNKKERYK